MKNLLIIIIMLLTAFTLNSVPPTVKNLNLEKYLGCWYEIARIPNRFQKQCSKNVKARYTLKTDGDIRVVNSCVNKKGQEEEVEGIAKVVDKVNNSKLKVSFVSLFGLNLFYGEYLIFDIAPDYSWAIVGSGNLKYGWILARDANKIHDDIDTIFASLNKIGFNSRDFVFTTQD